MNRFLGHDEIAEILIQNGADVNAVGPRNLTALNLAADKGKLHTATLNCFFFCVAITFVHNALR